MYKKAYHINLGYNRYHIHLWDDFGYEKVEWTKPAYRECGKEGASFRGLNGEYLQKTYKYKKGDNGIHFDDMTPYQHYLIERYGTDDTPSETHKEMFFDIECEMLDSLTSDYIKTAPKKITSIAWYDKQVNQWGILILDEKGKISPKNINNQEIIPCRNERELLLKFVDKMREIDPDILCGYNSDFFDIPYLYFRMCNVIGEDYAKHLSPIGYVRETPWSQDTFVQIIGVESLDYMRLHRKYSWEDEISWKLDDIGEKYANLKKIEYSGNLDDLFRSDIDLFIEYNFRDVEILVELDKHFEYLSLTKNLSHKGKHNYSEVYSNTKTQDGAISSYLLDKNIIPPSKDTNALKKGYAGGYLFCPKAGIYNYMFDEDLVSLYPSLIMTLNLGKETMVGRIVNENDRNKHSGLNDLRKMDPNTELIIENSQRMHTEVTAKKLIEIIVDNKFSISANGVMFNTNKKSVLTSILEGWFAERVKYKDKMKNAYTGGNESEGKKYFLLQYTQKILMNAVYGSLALGDYNRYGNVYLAEAVTLTGQRVIVESGLTVNRNINARMKGTLK